MVSYKCKQCGKESGLHGHVCGPDTVVKVTPAMVQALEILQEEEGAFLYVGAPSVSKSFKTEEYIKALTSDTERINQLRNGPWSDI